MCRVALCNRSGYARGKKMVQQYFNTEKMKSFLSRLKMAYAVIKASKSVVFIDKGKMVTRYVCGMTDDEIEEIADLDFNA